MMPAPELNDDSVPPHDPPPQLPGREPPPHRHARFAVWHTVLDRHMLRRRASRRRRYRIAQGLVLALLLALLGAYLYMTSDQQVERLTENYLRDLCKAQVDIGHASFSLFGGIEVKGIAVVVDDSARPIFIAERLQLTHDPLALLVGRLTVREISAVNPRINLDQRDGDWNYERLFPPNGSPGRPSAWQHPVIYVQNGLLAVRQFRGPKLLYEHDLRLSGVVLPDNARPGRFTFFTSELESLTAPPAEPPTQQVPPLQAPAPAAEQLPPEFRGAITRGTIDLVNRQVAFEGRATNVLLSPALAETLPPEARQVYERFAPSGLVSLKVAFAGRDLAGGAVGFRVEIVLNRVSVAALHDGRRWLLHDLTGLCVITPQEVRLLDVHGVLALSPPPKPTTTQAAPDADPAPTPDGTPLRESPETSSHVNLAVGFQGALTAIDQPHLGYDLAVLVEDVDFARIRGSVEELSRPVAAVYRNFDPTGRADLELRLVRRAEPDAPAELSGTVRLKGCHAVARWFPCAVEDLSGVLLLSPGRVDFSDLKGRHADAAVTISGSLVSPGTQAQVDLLIKALGVALADDLRHALAQAFPPYLAVYDSLHPQGRVDVDVKLHRPMGPDMPFVVDTDIRLRDTQVTYSGFPYRLDAGQGTVHFAAGRADIDVAGRHGAAAIAIRGAIARQADAPDVRLRIVGHDVPLDDDLAAALEPRQRHLYRRYHPSGRANLDVAVERSAQTRGQLVTHALIDFQDAAMVFEDFPYPVARIRGQMEISPDAFVVRDLRGANADGSVTAEGAVRQVGDAYAVDLTFRGTRITLDRDLRGAMALVAPDIWEAVRPEGLVDLVCRIRQDESTGGRLIPHIVLDARNVSLAYKDFPYPLRHAQGRITYDGRRAVIDQLQCQSGLSRLALSGTIETPPGAAVAADLALVTDPLQLDQDLLDALPQALAHAVRLIDLRGQAYANLDVLRYRLAPGRPPSAAWHGTAVIDNVAMNLGVPLDRLVAFVDLSGTLDEAGLGLKATLDVPQGRIAAKEFSDLHAELQQAPASHAVRVDRLEGRFYGGTLELESQGELLLAPAPRFDLVVKVRNVDFSRFVREGLGLDAPVQGGTMSGRFALRGSGAPLEPPVPGPATARQPSPDPANPQADIEALGQFVVENARLYELPAVVQIVNALSLRSDRGAFDQAEVEFFVRRRHWYFEKILLRSGDFVLQGAGRMDSDGRLDLVFATGAANAEGPLAVLSQLAAGLQHELALVEVTGTARQPKVQVRSFNALTAPLRELMTAVEESRKDRQQIEQRRRQRLKPPPEGAHK